MSGGHYDYPYGDEGGDGIPFSGRVSLDFPRPVAVPAPLASSPPPLSGPPLFLVKTRNTDPAHGRVEVHTALPHLGYGNGTHAVTRFGVGEQNNGWFQIIHRDLWFIKTRNVGSNRVEIHSATEASGYNAGQSNGTWMSPLDQSNGWFQVGIK